MDDRMEDNNDLREKDNWIIPRSIQVGTKSKNANKKHCSHKG